MLFFLTFGAAEFTKTLKCCSFLNIGAILTNEVLLCFKIHILTGGTTVI